MVLVNRISSKFPTTCVLRPAASAAKKKLLILDDGNTGHLRQCEAVCDVARQLFHDRGIAEIEISCEIVSICALPRRRPIAWPMRIWRRLTRGKRTPCSRCVPACAQCVRARLGQAKWAKLRREPAAAVISAGGAGWINLWIAHACGARSITVMNPDREAILHAVNLAIVPRHANLPADLPNVVVLDGAPNRIDEHRLAQFADRLGPKQRFRVGLLLGGDDYAYQLREQTVGKILDQLEQFLAARDGELLATTSQRTSSAVAGLLKQRLAHYSRCRYLVIANEANQPGAVETILATSDVVLVSPESISMISEAAASPARVVVFDEIDQVAALHQRFLYGFSCRGYIEVASISTLCEVLLQPRPSRPLLNDRETIRLSLESLL